VTGPVVDGAVDDPEDRDPGLSRERTSLAWTRTALSFAAVGGAILKKEIIPGLIIMCAAPAIWQLGRMSRRPAYQLKLVTVTIVVVAVAALIVSLTQKS
jgi:uncharacterized membrane protein YidH (DUF202 family)